MRSCGILACEKHVSNDAFQSTSIACAALVPSRSIIPQYSSSPYASRSSAPMFASTPDCRSKTGTRRWITFTHPPGVSSTLDLIPLPRGSFIRCRKGGPPLSPSTNSTPAPWLRLRVINLSCPLRTSLVHAGDSSAVLLLANLPTTCPSYSPTKSSCLNPLAAYRPNPRRPTLCMTALRATMTHGSQLSPRTRRKTHWTGDGPCSQFSSTTSHSAPLSAACVAIHFCSLNCTLFELPFKWHPAYSQRASTLTLAWRSTTIHAPERVLKPSLYRLPSPPTTYGHQHHPRSGAAHVGIHSCDAAEEQWSRGRTTSTVLLSTQQRGL
jgi:hypothetical protein